MHLIFAKPWSKGPVYSYFQPAGSGVASILLNLFRKAVLCQVTVALAVPKKMPLNFVNSNTMLQLFKLLDDLID